MKVGKIEKVERKYVLLEKGIDFNVEDITNTKEEPAKEAKFLSRFARDIGYDKWSFCGHYDADAGTLEVIFEKNIYV